MSTKPFKITRTQLSWIAAEEYVRTFWWYAGIVPVFGIVMLIFASGPLQVIGMMALLFPLSIPARSVIATRKASRLFSAGCRAEIEPEVLTFYDTSGRQVPLRWRIPLSDVRDVMPRRDMLLVRMRMFGIAPIPVEAFETEGDRAHFQQIIESAVAARLA